VPLAIEAAGVARRLGGTWALRGVDLQVPSGRAVMLFGSNGAGKTTLIRLLGTATRPSLGTLRLLGGPAEDARPRVGLLSHADHHYDDLTARENLHLAARLPTTADRRRTDEDVARTLVEVGLAGREDHAVRGFSAGMRKRLAFARILLKRPDLVLLDEPYAQLDPEGHTFVDLLLGRLRAAGTTLVVSTHQVTRVAPLCDDAVRLGGGKVTWAGPASDAPGQLAPGPRPEDA